MSIEDAHISEDWATEDVMKKDVMLSYSITNSQQNTPMNVSGEDVYPTVMMSDDECGNSEEEEVEDREPDYRILTIKNGRDVASIPITKEGMAVCEKCGTIGVKHAFYSKSKKFCSLSCSKSYCDMEREGKPIPKPKPVFKFPLENVKVKKKLSLSKSPSKVSPSVGKTLPVKESNDSFNWESYLSKSDFKAALVSSFKHAPLSDCWDHIIKGMKVEVENRDDGFRDLFPQTYWVATVMAVAGYKVLLRYEGFGSDDSEDFWLNLCKQHVQPVGWCASQGKPLIPPRSIQHKCHDWKQFLVKKLTGARTLPSDFHQKVKESITSRFKPGMQLEVVDKNCISTVCLAYVQEVIGGRLHVRYHGSESWDDGFWCHEKSPLIHPIGWAQLVGHNANMSPELARIAGQKAVLNKYNENEACWDMFQHAKLPPSNIKFREGMKLEAIDPLNLSSVCVATVTKVLKRGYLMIGIDGYIERESDWFCHRATSGSIFPAGFCELNNIALTSPKEYRGIFHWGEYLCATKSSAVPVALFNGEIPNHRFEVGMHLEAVDLMEPGLICVGTITKVIGRLLRIHFDGWDDSYDQWCDCESPDLYPVGWCELVGYRLESPKTNEQEKKRKTKTAGYKGARKKRRVKMILGKQKNAMTVSPVRSFEETKPAFVQNANVVSETPPLTERDSNLDVGCSRVHVSASQADVEDKSTAAETSLAAGKTIPRLIDNVSSGLTLTSHQSVITPELWTVFDVSQFLRINDCAAHCESFSKKVAFYCKYFEGL
ncbi:MBT domain-containing protein 1, variant 2 [Chamberlinius hualienensis]